MNAVDHSYGAVVFDAAKNAENEPLYLLVLHSGGNHWGHPKGHREGSETHLETARREIAEEACISVEFIDGFSTEASWILPDGRRKIVRYFLARRIGSFPAPPSGNGDEILDSLWLPYSACRKKITYQSAKDVLDRAQGFISRATLQNNAPYSLPG